MNKIGRNLRKISNSTLPKSPTTVQEVIDVYENPNVMQAYGKTLHNEKDSNHGLTKAEFFKHAYESKEFSYCIFASDNIINKIKLNITINRRKYLLDATLKVCPFGVFNQLLIIYVEYLGEVNDYYFHWIRYIFLSTFQFSNCQNNFIVIDDTIYFNSDVT